MNIERPLVDKKFLLLDFQNYNKCKRLQHSLDDDPYYQRAHDLAAKLMGLQSDTRIPPVHLKTVRDFYPFNQQSSPGEPFINDIDLKKYAFEHNLKLKKGTLHDILWTHIFLWKRIFKHGDSCTDAARAQAPALEQLASRIFGRSYQNVKGDPYKQRPV